jgi:hypothetical protein
MIVSDSKQDLGVFSRKAVLTEVGNRRLQARVRCRPQASLVTVATLLVDHRLRRGTRRSGRRTTCSKFDCGTGVAFPGDGTAPQRGAGVKQSLWLAKMDPNDLCAWMGAVEVWVLLVARDVQDNLVPS